MNTLCKLSASSSYNYPSYGTFFNLLCFTFDCLLDFPYSEDEYSETDQTPLTLTRAACLSWCSQGDSGRPSHFPAEQYSSIVEEFTPHVTAY